MSFRIGMLLFPNLTQLDLTGPYEVLSRIPGSEIHLVWKHKSPVQSDSGLGFLPTTTVSECPDLDLLFVPGGGGQIEVMDDDEVMDFVARKGARARWLTSVCTGAFVLGGAGLLRGRAAATHWAFLPLLSLFGARPVDERIVVDGNLITAGGVTAGIDFGLRVLAEVAGADLARATELAIEYDPKPPFGCGHPRSAPPELTEKVRKGFAERYAVRKDQAERIASRAARANV